MRGIHEGVDNAPIEFGDKLADGQDQRRRAGDLADQDQTGPWGDRLEDHMERVVRVSDRKRDPGDHDPGAIARRHHAQRIDRGVVLVGGREQLVSGLEAERLQDRVDARRGVGHESEPVGIGAK